MAGRLQQLNGAEQGIDRRKTKGGASQKTLYDLVNGYVDATGSIVSRPGTVETHILPAGSRGMCAFEGGLVVFSSVNLTMPAGVTNEILTHPSNPAATLVEIHYAGPFLGSLYVTAEWSDGGVFDYWLQSAPTWAANTNYELYDLVSPTALNGLTYKAHRLTPPGDLWTANTEYAVGDVVEPPVFNGYEYVCIEAYGSPARSGSTEPEWPAADGATVTEEADLTPSDGGGQTVPPPGAPPRYGNPGGNKPPGKGGFDNRVEQ